MKLQGFSWQIQQLCHRGSSTQRNPCTSTTQESHFHRDHRLIGSGLKDSSVLFGKIMRIFPKWSTLFIQLFDFSDDSWDCFVFGRCEDWKMSRTSLRNFSISCRKTKTCHLVGAKQGQPSLVQILLGPTFKKPMNLQGCRFAFWNFDPSSSSTTLFVDLKKQLLPPMVHLKCPNQCQPQENGQNLCLLLSCCTRRLGFFRSTAPLSAL